MKEGESERLTAIVRPDYAANKNVKWTSSDSSVVTVDQNGKLTAKKPGTATIRVTTEEGGYTAQCIVYVIENRINADYTSGYVGDAANKVLFNVKPGTTVGQLRQLLYGDGIEVRAANGKLMSATDLVTTGTQLRLIINGKQYDSLTVSVLGDVDGDGKALASDARLVLRYCAKIDSLSAAQKYAADTDLDDSVKPSDARIILRVVAKLHKL